MSKSIAAGTKKKLQDYQNASLAMLVVDHAIEGSYTINDIAKAAEVSRMAIANWINGSEVRDINLAHLILNLKLESVIELIIKPNQYQDEYNAAVIKKTYVLQNEWNRIKKVIEKLKLENPDLGKKLLKRKYFKYFGKKMIEEAIAGFYYYDPVILPWDIEDINAINSIDDYVKLCFYLKSELERDGFGVEGDDDEGSNEEDINDDKDVDEKEDEDESYRSTVKVEIGKQRLSELLKLSHETLVAESQFSNLQKLMTKIGDFTCYSLKISWLGAETKREDNFAWFLEWLHTPGQVLMDKIFSEIKEATSQSIYRIELPFYTICPNDYDENGFTHLKDDNYSYRDDLTSLYYEGIEIPVNQAFLREFFVLKGFKFSFKRDAVEINKHIAYIDWS